MRILIRSGDYSTWLYFGRELEAASERSPWRGRPPDPPPVRAPWGGYLRLRARVGQSRPNRSKISHKPFKTDPTRPQTGHKLANNHAQMFGLQAYGVQFFRQPWQHSGGQAHIIDPAVFNKAFVFFLSPLPPGGPEVVFGLSLYVRSRGYGPDPGR